MNTLEFDSFITILRRDFSPYLGEGLIDDMEESFDMNELDRVSSLATRIHREIPEGLMTDTVLDGLEAIQATSRRKGFSPKTHLVEQKSPKKKYTEPVVTPRSKLTDTDLATFQYYLHLLGRGLQERSRRDIKSVMTGCHQQAPLVQELYKTACNADNVVKQVKTRDRAMTSCITWYEDTLRRLLDSGVEQVGDIPYIARDVMLHKNERAMFDITYHLLEEMQSRLRQHQVKGHKQQFFDDWYNPESNRGFKYKHRQREDKEDPQPKIKELERRNKELKDKLSHLKKQTEVKVAQLDNTSKDSANKGKNDETSGEHYREKTTDTKSDVTNSEQRETKLEKELNDSKLKENQKERKSNTTNSDTREKKLEKEIDDLKLKLMFHEEGKGASKLQEEITTLKEKNKKLYNEYVQGHLQSRISLQNKREQNKKQLETIEALNKENAELKRKQTPTQVSRTYLEESGQQLKKPKPHKAAVVRRTVQATTALGIRPEKDIKQMKTRDVDEKSKTNYDERHSPRIEQEKPDDETKTRLTEIESHIIPTEEASERSRPPVIERRDKQYSVDDERRNSTDNENLQRVEQEKSDTEDRLSVVESPIIPRQRPITEFKPHAFESRTDQYSTGDKTSISPGSNRRETQFEEDNRQLQDRLGEERRRAHDYQRELDRVEQERHLEEIFQDADDRPSSTEQYSPRDESPVSETRSRQYRRPRAKQVDKQHYDETDSGRIDPEHTGGTRLKESVKPYMLESGSVNHWKEAIKRPQSDENGSLGAGRQLQAEHGDRTLKSPEQDEGNNQERLQANTEGRLDSGNIATEGDKKRMKDRVKPYLLETSSVNQWKKTASRPRPKMEEMSDIGRVKGENVDRDTTRLQDEISKLNDRNDQLERQLEQQQRELKSKLDNQHRDVRSVQSDLEQDKDDIKRRYENKIDQLQRDIRNLKSDFSDDKDDLQKRLSEVESEKSELERTNDQLEREKQEMEEKLQLTLDENERNVETFEHLEKNKSKDQTGRTKPENLEATAVQQWKESAKKSKEEKSLSDNSFLDTNEKTMEELVDENRKLQEEIGELKLKLLESQGEQPDLGTLQQDGNKRTLKDGVTPFETEMEAIQTNSDNFCVKKFMLESASVNQWKGTTPNPHTEEKNDIGEGADQCLDEKVKQLLAENSRLSQRLQEAESQLGLPEDDNKLGLKPQETEDGHLQDRYQSELDQQERDLRNVKSDLEDDKDDIQRRYQNKIDQLQRDIRNVRSDLEGDKNDLEKRLRQTESEKSDLERTINQLEREKQDLEEKLQQTIDENERNVGTEQDLERERSNVLTRADPAHLESSTVQQWKETAQKSKTEKSKPGNSFLDTGEKAIHDLEEENRQLKDENTQLQTRLQEYEGDHSDLGKDNQDGVKKGLKDRVKPYMLETASVNQWKETMSRPQAEENSGNTGEVTHSNLEDETKDLRTESMRLNESLQAAYAKISDLEEANVRLPSPEKETGNIQDRYEREIDQHERKLRSVKSDLEQDNDDNQKRYQNRIDQLQRDIRNVKSDLEDDKNDLQNRLKQTEAEKSDLERKVNQLENEKQDLEERLQVTIDENERHMDTVQEKAGVQTTVKARTLEGSTGSATVQDRSEKAEILENQNSIRDDRYEDEQIEAKRQSVTQTSKVKEDVGVKDDNTEIPDDSKKIEELEVQVMYLESEKKSVDQRNLQIKKQLDQQKHELQRTKSELLQCQEKNEELQNRYSKVAEAKLTHDNPNIADLNDRNRPTKLAEQFSELYDNEWTEAFSALEDELGDTVSEEEITEQLKNILLDCFKQLSKISTKQMAEIKALLFSTCNGASAPPASHLTTEQSKTITQLRKQTTSFAIETLKQEITKTYQGHTHYSDLKSFIERCTELCWLMVIQSPPVVIDDRHRPGDRFDKDVFKAYTKAGKVIDFVVWPPVYLHKGGPLLCKGTAQGKR